MSSSEQKPRLPSSDIRIEYCNPEDMEKVAEGLYLTFPDSWWSQFEPHELRPDDITRNKRLAKRLIPALDNPDMHYLKAIHVPTGSIAGIAGWAGPEHPHHTAWRYTAFDVYNWKSKYGYSDEEFEEMWSGTLIDKWEAKLEKDDKKRIEVLKGQKHWYLAPLYTFPEFQSQGVAGLLLKWAMEKADATDPVTPLYLESSVKGRPVYTRYGFVAVEETGEPGKGPANMVRRGPRVVEEEGAKEEVAKDAGVEVAVKGVDGQVAPA